MTRLSVLRGGCVIYLSQMSNTLGANHLTFEGGGGLEDLEKNSLQPPKEGKKNTHGKLRGKKYHAWIVRQKKIPANHRHFSMGWLVGANPCL